MKILAIETSCDESAIAILEATGDDKSARYKVLGNALVSQIDLHRQYGGVFPALAKREHAKNLTPILENALTQAQLFVPSPQTLTNEQETKLAQILEREQELYSALSAFLPKLKRPDIDAIAVTYGPGLEPALWVGINLARALSYIWNIPIVPINHMEGHLLSSVAKKEGETLIIENVQLPLLALLISGGHTELVVMNKWLSYQLLGETRDDAVGEAFDKVARMMDLPYPGGPEISKLAETHRTEFPDGIPRYKLPKPMFDTEDCDFSFSGLKTSILYLLKETGTLTSTEKAELARAFEDTVSEVLWKKTARAIEQSNAQSLVVGGGVSANTHIQRVFTERIQQTYPQVTLTIPPRELSTDNAVMIGLAGFFRAKQGEYRSEVIAVGNLPLAA